MPKNVSSTASLTIGRMYLEAKPNRRALSVISAEAAAPARNATSRNPNSSIGAALPFTRCSAKCVALPVAWETTSPHMLHAMTLV